MERVMERVMETFMVSPAVAAASLFREKINRYIPRSPPPRNTIANLSSTVQIEPWPWARAENFPAIPVRG